MTSKGLKISNKSDDYIKFTSITNKLFNLNVGLPTEKIKQFKPA